ncbi:MAG TPA: HypC/HybG/HupF family hydrogenase formation chaperone [Nitrospiria bacterium]
MCLAIPGKVIDIDETARPRMGRASFGGIVKQVCLEWIPEVRIGDYVIVHVGFAISRMDETEALKTLELFGEIEGALDELKIPEVPDNPSPY